jgi:serine/threonine protein kinase
MNALPSLPSPLPSHSILANMKHVNILPFHGLVLEPVSCLPKWLVTSYATGKTLKHQLARRRRAAGGITLLELVDIMVDVMEGLAYLHCRQPEPIILR